MQEIERKFLVDIDLWNKLSKPVPKKIVQAYIVSSIEKTIRIRIKDKKGYLTIKGPTENITRSEFEYEIPLNDAEQIIQQFGSKVLTKSRFEIKIDHHLWEVDVFEGKLAGLIVAEIELRSEDELFITPEWITEEVSDDSYYYNSNLINQL